MKHRLHYDPMTGDGPKRTDPKFWCIVVAMTREYIIDGSKITSQDAFYDEISRVLIPGQEWGRNLDAFNDLLRGGFGTPENGFSLIWMQAAYSKEKLGYHFEAIVEIIRCHGEGGEEAEDNIYLELK